MMQGAPWMWLVPRDFYFSVCTAGFDDEGRVTEKSSKPGTDQAITLFCCAYGRWTWKFEIEVREGKGIAGPVGGRVRRRRRNINLGAETLRSSVARSKDFPLFSSFTVRRRRPAVVVGVLAAINVSAA